MSERTKIQWADSTGNPWIGCTKVSPGCKNCYAEALDRQRFSRTMGGGTKEKPVSHWGAGAPRFRTKQFWKDALKWNAAQTEWRNRPCDPKWRPVVDQHRNPRIFPSMCDWLDEEVPIEWLADFLKLINDTPNLDWLLLTKRPENFTGRISDALALVEQIHGDWPDREPETELGHMLNDWIGSIPPANVWVGVSVEDQERAQERIPALLKIPARLRFLSVEPLLGPLEPEWDACLYSGYTEGPQDDVVNWVIVGGESGKDARACHVGWVRDIVRACKRAEVPCFVKQLGAHVIEGGYPMEKRWYLRDGKGGDPVEWPEDLRVREFPERAKETKGTKGTQR